MITINPITGAVVPEYPDRRQYVPPREVDDQLDAEFSEVLADAIRDGYAQVVATVGGTQPEEGAGFADMLTGAIMEEMARISAADAEPPSQFSAGFADIITEAIRDEMMRMGAIAGVEDADGATPELDFRTQAIEQAIIDSASSGELTNTHIVLLMLVMMMQSSDAGGSSMLMQMMAALLGQIGQEDPQFAGGPGPQHSPQHRLDISEYQPDATEKNPAILPDEFWVKATPSVTSNAEDRNPERYTDVINQFKVETAERYRPYRNGFTYCNIFVIDVSRAMDVEIPHMGAIAMCNWLGTTGSQHGWREVDAETAQRYANAGRPAVTSAGSIGHVQMVIPSKDGEYNQERGVTIAQAGSTNSSYTHIRDIYGSNGMRNVRYFVND